LRELGLCAVFSTPLRRACQTAEHIAAAGGLEVRRDDRLRERMNWDGTQPIEDFLAELGPLPARPRLQTPHR